MPGDPTPGDSPGGDSVGGDPLAGDPVAGDPVGGDNEGGDRSGGDDGAPYCTSGKQCRSGICEGGDCVPASSCLDHGECSAVQYCHFPSAPIPWVSGTSGDCEGPCTIDDSCGIIGQECHSYLDYRRCYTNIDCNPAHNSTDCPPGEVCWQDSRTCKWPPDTCYFAAQCPLTADGVRWVCDPATGDCIDPTDVGECDEDGDCDSMTGCSTGCTCRDHVCEIAGSCDPTPAGDTACGIGNYCAGGVCQPATPCGPPDDDGHGQCLPYSLVCRSGYCSNPTPCTQPGNQCTDDWECNTYYNPPVCYPPGVAGCIRHDQCPPDMYCSIPDGACQIGCRDHGGCIGQCGGPTTPCYCQNDNSCGTAVVAAPGALCSEPADCMSGTLCALDDLVVFPLCEMTPGDPQCTKHCRLLCDRVASVILSQCLPDEACGGDGSALVQAILDAYGALFDNGSASVCYPTN